MLLEHTSGIHTSPSAISSLLLTSTTSDSTHLDEINDFGPQGWVADHTHQISAAVEFVAMSTFASLLPSLQAAFFSRSQPVKEEADVVAPESEAEAQVPTAESPAGASVANLHPSHSTPAALNRPSALRAPSSTSSAQTASSAGERDTTVEGLVWKDGERVDYDPEREVRARKGGKRHRREKRKQETETFVIVRPPPSSSKRTLNLQIQLVSDVKQKKGSVGRESRSASGSSLASTSGTTTAGLRRLNILEDIPSSSAATTVTITPREVDFKRSAERTVTQSRDASPTRKLPGQYEAGLHDGRNRKPLHKRTSSMSLDGGIQEIKQNILEQLPAKSRPLSTSMVIPVPQSQEVGRDMDASFAEGEIRRSFEEDSDGVPGGQQDKSLSRCSSIRSVGSSHSCASTSLSAVSGISLSGISTSSSGRTGRTGRGKIVPLYNLAVHNVMTTTVTDAGTDSKIAKFHKRSVDIVGLGTLEATEVWTKSPADMAKKSRTSQSTIAADRIELAAPILERGSTRLSSKDAELIQGPSSSAANQQNDGTPSDQHPGSKSPPPPFDRTKKLFGKFFKKKDTTASSSVPPPSPSKQGFQAIAEHLTSPLSPQGTRNPFAAAGMSTSMPFIQYGQPTFGMSPVIVTVPSASSRHRPQVYTWTVKRWAPAGELTIVNEWTSRLAPLINGDAAASKAALGEVVFEWKKGKSKSATVSRTTTRTSSMPDPQLLQAVGRQSSLAPLTSQAPFASSRPGSRTGSRRGSYMDFDQRLHATLASASRSPSPSMLRKKSSAGESAMSTLSSKVSFDDITLRRDTSEVSQQATLHARAASPAPSSISRGAQTIYDEGGESDPEDSETPWICKVYVPGARVTTLEGPIQAKGKTVGTMYPAPHHPKVVASLKIPVQLGDMATGIGALMGPATLSHQDVTASTQGGLKSSINSLSSPPLTGISQPSQQPVDPVFKQEEIIMTEENIKDVVSVTAMWLVSREFGALGKKKKISG